MGDRPLLDVAVGWPLFASLSLCTGSVAARWVVVPREGAGCAVPSAELLRSAARIGRAAAGVLLVALALVLVRQVLEFRDPFAPWSAEARLLLTGTTWGRVWMLAAGVGVAAAAGFHRAARDGSAGWWTATAAVLALGAFPALTGHANGGGLRPLTLLADTLHVWAAGGWVGGLTLVLALESGRRRAQGPDAPSFLPILVPRFSRLAMACVATLAVTGTFAAWVHIGRPADLAGTAYGRLLLAKLAFVGAALALGALNFQRHTPNLSEAGGRAEMVRAAALELALAGVVLAVTALLVRTSPT